MTLLLQNPAVVIGDGSGYRHSTGECELNGQGASHMVGTHQDGDVGWTGFEANTTVTFSEADGPKNLYAKFKDAAGNETDEISASVTLDTTGTINGLIVVEEKADASVALFLF